MYTQIYINPKKKSNIGKSRLKRKEQFFQHKPIIRNLYIILYYIDEHTLVTPKQFLYLCIENRIEIGFSITIYHKINFFNTSVIQWNFGFTINLYYMFTSVHGIRT